MQLALRSIKSWLQHSTAGVGEAARSGYCEPLESVRMVQLQSVRSLSHKKTSSTVKLIGIMTQQPQQTTGFIFQNMQVERS